MGDRLRHRGPDDSGEWSQPALGIALAFRRLSIIDLSEFGHQPMLSNDGRFALVLNGEVYNHCSLRAELTQQGHCFRGHSDTEVLLRGISTWGLEKTLQRSAGMFALALVDIQQRRLWLARDRLGEKPLYYGWSSGCFFFGSELKAFRPHPSFLPEVDRRALTLYLRFGYVPSPWSILVGFRKLLPGHMLSLVLDGSAAPGKETMSSYWSLPKPGEHAVLNRSPEDWVHQLQELLRQAIRLQMLADVQVGAFLSGGIDSSTVVSLMQGEATRPVKTFTVGFPDSNYDESVHAEKIAKHLGTEQTTWRCADSELLELATKMPQVYCEPFADDSQLPTLALARMARRQVTVCISGDGGDELFHGYGRYETSLRRWHQLQRHPQIRTTASCVIGAGSAVVSLLADSPFQRSCSSRLAKARNQWLARNLPCYYRHRMSLHKAPDLYLSRPELTRDFFDETGENLGLEQQEVAWLSYLDLNTYLPDDLLVKVDRAAMAFSLETRMPLLDHRVVEFAVQMPDTIKRRFGRAKWPLRAILEQRIAPELTERPKMGFCTPMGRWLRGPLFEWAEAYLSEDRLRREDFFAASEVCRLWRKHQQGSRDSGLLLWGLLMFQAWHESF